MQQALAEEGAAQCGYCTPAMALRAAALLSEDPEPDDHRIAEAMGANICRCGCYPRIARAVHRAAAMLGEPGLETPRLKPVSVAPSFVRPPRPWDLCDPREPNWFEVLGDGLVVVWPPQVQSPGMWPVKGGAWLHISPSGIVTAFSGKVDVGQDNHTAFRLLVAEELAVDVDDVRVLLGDTDLCPFDIGTFGSRSMPDAGEALRRAAAGARRILVSMAADRSGVAVGDVTASDGALAGGPGGAILDYGGMLAGARLLEVLEEEPALTAPEAWRFVGSWGRGPSRLDVVTGACRFVSDLDRPGMLYGAILRPPVRGGSLRWVDPGPAEHMPGVSVVREGDDFLGVVAGDPVTARRAIAAVRAEWDEPPLGPLDVAEHLRTHPVAGQGWERASEEAAGDVEAGIAGAPVRVEATYTTAYIAHTPLETRAAVAEWNGNRLTVWTGTQVPFGVRARLADDLGIDEADVRVLVPPTGGGFGGKHGSDVANEAARLARAAGRAVKVHWSRAEEFRWGTLRPMAVIDIRAALDSAGSISAWDFLDINAGPAGIALPYSVPNWRLRYQPADSPLAQGSYRALGATANHFARESHIDELARTIGADPVEFRLRHLGDDRLAAVLRAVAERFGWGSSRTAETGSRHGSGIAAGLEKGGRVATCAEVRLDDNGDLSVTRIVTAYECGAVVNPDTVVNQIEGGTVMALGGALFEEVALDHGHLAGATLAGYRVPRFGDVPPLEVVLIDRPDIPFAGAGETPLVTVAPAVANAIFSATGKRLRSLPLVPGGSLT